jgi:predicted transcriptional regulator
MKEAIHQYLEREELAEQFRQEALAAWEEFQTTGQYMSDEDMTAWLESWGSDTERDAPAPCQR